MSTPDRVHEAAAVGFGREAASYAGIRPSYPQAVVDLVAHDTPAGGTVCDLAAGTGIFTRPVIILMLLGGIWSTIINLGLFIWADSSGRSHSEAMTMTFVSLVLIQFFKAYNFRSDRHSVLNKPFANKWLNWAIIFDFLFLLVIVYVPWFHEPFGTFSLPWQDWARTYASFALAGTAVLLPVLMFSGFWPSLVAGLAFPPLFVIATRGLGLWRERDIRQILNFAEQHPRQLGWARGYLQRWVEKLSL